MNIILYLHIDGLLYTFLCRECKCNSGTDFIIAFFSSWFEMFLAGLIIFILATAEGRYLLGLIIFILATAEGRFLPGLIIFILATAEGRFLPV